MNKFNETELRGNIKALALSTVSLLLGCLSHLLGNPTNQEKLETASNVVFYIIGFFLICNIVALTYYLSLYFRLKKK